MQRFSARGKQGFTLIELLVVIAIIAILASMLFPVFSRARMQAYKVDCISNLRQLGMAMEMYKQDHDGYFPLAWAFWTPLYNLPTQPNLRTAMDSYIRDDRLWWCRAWTGRYGYNAWSNPRGGNYDFIIPSQTTSPVIGDPGTRTVWSESSLSQPSMYPLLWCGSHIGATLNAHSGANDDAFFQGREVGGTNILYADNHSKYENLDVARWVKLYTSPR